MRVRTRKPVPTTLAPAAVFFDGRASIYNADSRYVLRKLPSNSVDAIVCDPPYGLAFMQKNWDDPNSAPFDLSFWQEALRVLKPGGHLVAFSGSRTYHRMAVTIEDAGFEIRDMLQWLYGSGFPKSLDVSKAIDKAAGATREVLGVAGKSGSVRSCMSGDFTGGEYMSTAPATDAACQWEGWGTALKPAQEPIVLARKPLSEDTVAANVLTYGTGAINIDVTRIGVDGGTRKEPSADRSTTSSVGSYLNAKAGLPIEGMGRWPSNVVHDGSPEVLAGFPQTKPARAGRRNSPKTNGVYGAYAGDEDERLGHIDGGGSAARFMYCAKASKTDRCGSTHPTVKPVSLMRWLVRLVTPPGGTVLDPFCGSGTTAQAAIEEGFSVIGVEYERQYFQDICRRLARHTNPQALKASPVAARKIRARKRLMR